MSSTYLTYFCEKFGEPVEVNRLDIGNNGSAFVEVLVRRAASSASPMVMFFYSFLFSTTDTLIGFSPLLFFYVTSGCEK